MRTVSPALLPLLLGALFAAAGCEPDNACDPGQTHIRNACLDSPPGHDGSAVVLDGGSDLGGSDGGGCSAPNGGFGQKCASAADCPCGLDFCVNYGAYNFCTRTGCLKNEGLCPEGWFCIDTSLYQPGGPAICFKQ